MTERAAQLAGQTKYQEALALYQGAYELVHEPRLLMNLGRCHFRLGRARKALELYASFQQAMPNADPQLTARLGQFIDEAKQAIESDTGNQPPPADKRDQVTLIVPSTPAPEDEPPPAFSTSGTGRLVLGRPVYRIVLGASALGLGLVSLGLGAGAVAGNGTCVSASDAATGMCALMTRPDGSQFTRVFDGLTPGIPLLVVGAALTAGGIALIAVPPRKPAGNATRPK
jgi:hypothetical protein